MTSLDSQVSALADERGEPPSRSGFAFDGLEERRHEPHGAAGPAVVLAGSAPPQMPAGNAATSATATAGTHLQALPILPSPLPRGGTVPYRRCHTVGSRS